MNKLPDIIINNDQSSIPVNFDIAHFSLAVCQHLQLVFDHLEITLLSPAAIQVMNFDYFKNDTPTDTISFNLSPDEGITGDIYLCPDVIYENSKRYATQFNEEFKIVIIHSLLHLQGHTDETTDDHEKMNQLQQNIYQELSY